MRIGQNEHRAMRPARNADHLGVIRLADDDDRAAVLAVRLYKLMNVRHMRDRSRQSPECRAAFTLRIDLASRHDCG